MEREGLLYSEAHVVTSMTEPHRGKPDERERSA